VDYAKEGIRVNSISPGAFPSAVAQDAEPELMRQLENLNPLGRLGEARDIRGAVVFLASTAASYVTGSNLVVDGGWTAW